MNRDYRIDKISQKLLKEIKGALASITGWGSLELYVQNNEVTQITVRNIKKTSITKGNIVNNKQK